MRSVQTVTITRIDSWIHVNRPDKSPKLWFKQLNSWNYIVLSDSSIGADNKNQNNQRSIKLDAYLQQNGLG